MKPTPSGKDIKGGDILEDVPFQSIDTPDSLKADPHLEELKKKKMTNHCP